MEYRVGHLKLQPHRQLLDGAEPLPLGRKALDLMSVLAKAQGALVTKDELMAAVWPGVIVEENAIQVHIATLRRALGEAASNLSTVRGLGYRLTAEPLASAAAASAAPAKDPLVAVLAFENQSSDPDLGYFAEGVSEEILQAIARVNGVRVIARNSSFQLTDKQRSTTAVAALLGATHILDGSVRREGDRLRISAHLVEAASETILWSERFDGSLANVFAVQERIAGSVAGAFKLKMAPPIERAPINPLAYDLYLQGRRLTGPNEMRQQSVDCFTAALEIEPGFADAWASLALAHALTARWDSDDIPFAERAAKARAAAERALALNPAAAIAHVTLGALEPKGGYLSTEAHFQRALHCAPRDSEALRQYAILAYETGRVAEAFDCVERALATDPLNPSTTQNYAMFMAEIGRLTDSYAIFATARKRWPDLGWFYEPILYSAFASDWATLDVLLAEPGTHAPAVSRTYKTALALRHPTEKARREALAGAERQFARLGRIEVSMMIFLYALGLSDEAFALLERSNYSFMFKPDGRGDLFFAPGIHFSITNRAMRDDPRFVRLCDKLGLCIYWRETGRWPDCVDDLPYDFRDAVHRIGTA